MWAEVTVVQELSAWHAVYDEYVPAAVTPGQVVNLSSDAKAAFERATAELTLAVRKELSPGDSASLEQLTSALFNNTAQTTP